MKFRVWLAVLLLGAMIILAGCAALNVQPWDRDILAQKKMLFAPDPMDQFFDQHIQFSKEAAMGGQSVGGGGCGCN